MITMEARAEFRRLAAELTRRTPPLRPVTTDSPVGSGRPIHRHDGHELRFILSAAGAPERVEVIYPGVCHHALSLAECGRAHILSLTPEQAGYSHRLKLRGTFVSEYIPVALRAIARLRCAGSADAAADAAAECRLLLALTYLCAVDAAPSGEPEARIDRFIRHLHDFYYRHDLSIARAAAEVGYSPNYVQKVFRAVTGEGPREYLIRIRLEAARRFLQEGRYSIKEVASLCGFSGEHYFSTVFRRRFGSPPGRYAAETGSAVTRRFGRAPSAPVRKH